MTKEEFEMITQKVNLRLLCGNVGGVAGMTTVLLTTNPVTQILVAILTVYVGMAVTQDWSLKKAVKELYEGKKT